MKPKDNFSTKLIHAREPDKKPENALNNPIFMTSTFTFDSLEAAEAAFEFETDDYVYTRGNNPTLKIFEDKMAEIENGAAGVAFASGMGAISATLLSLLEPGDNIVAHQILYGSSYKLINEWLRDYNIEGKLVDFNDFEKLDQVVDKNTKVLYMETPANPTLEVIDIERIAEIAKENDCKLVVDNTFASPYLQNPIDQSANIVIHSATKYLGGHGDLVGGVVVADSRDYAMDLKFNYLTELGSVMSPFNAWLILRGMKTLKLRMEAAQANAMKIVEFLQADERVKSVNYPGLESKKSANIWEKQMLGPGAMLSFELDADVNKIREFVNNLDYFKLAVSLGDIESLIEYPFFMTHRDYDKKILDRLGISKYLLRISAGLEDAEILIEDIENNLQKL
ncbi:aminotransferase class I/II-fold pyridoxal phosphate-dependent enzyme [Halanaerobiaceae bacterium Z-7014]|uniref:homocysteine desulfhydrase n=1 Tax=Halonatronomonas betaini TaxID=2778430 RepID=A0A931AV06_9FIRM|nr:aminotransferase class I/II-fold pyridoxal phosphate-dependent enzyme [Halonatronomonas betaini]